MTRWAKPMTDVPRPATPGQTYRQAGVDLEASQDVKRRIGNIVARTHGPEVLAGVGAFGALYSFSGYADPVLVASTDPVGTKLKLAVMTGRFEGIGEDLVNACVNDVIVCGAKPLLFLDYINMSSLRPETVVTLVEGMARACGEVDCALIGGETAEMPGVFAGDNFDVSGFVLGVVERDAMIDTTKIAPGDVLIGIPSNGLHTNGYSLVRHIYALDSDPAPLDEYRPELGETLGDALLRPHPPYYNELRPVFGAVKGIAHVTGGGLIENVPRMLPEDVAARFDTSSWTLPPIFSQIQEDGGVSREEMYRVFNMGLGMVLVCQPDRVGGVLELIPDALEVGEIVEDIEDRRVIL